MSGAEQALATLRDYVQRSTHCQEGGATRHDALLALKVLTQWQSSVKGAELEMTAALVYADEIAMRKETDVAYETLQRSAFKRKEGWRRKYNLSDARNTARLVAIRLRNAWQLLDPLP